MLEFIQNFCKWKNSLGPVEIITILLSITTLFCTIIIPIRIMKFQRYTNLFSTYMSMEFAHAFQSVINFFYDDCGCDVERIPEEYKKRFISDFSNLDENKIDINDVLHYQRRLLNDYFMELEMCRESSKVLRNIIRKDWTASEAWVCKILIFMNKAIDDDPEMFKDISAIKHERMPMLKGLSEYLKNFYNALRNESRNMQL